MPPLAQEESAVPDGGWSWLVLAAGFTVYFINDGIDNSFGLLSVELIKQMGATRQSIGWIVSLKCACMYFVCPLAAVLCHYLDTRIVGGVAGLLSFLGFFAASFAREPWHLFVTIGLVTGLGVGTCFFISIVSICLYFSRLRATASGIALCGAGLGGLALNPLLSYLLSLYGWQSSLMLLSALYLNTLPCCLLYRPLGSSVGQQDASEAGSRSLESPQLLMCQQQQLQKTSSDSFVAEGDIAAVAAAASATIPPAAAHNSKTEMAAEADADSARRRLRQTAAWLSDCLLLAMVPWPPPPTPQLESAGNSNAAATAAVSATCQRLRRCRNPRLLAFQASRVFLAAAVPTVYAYSADRGLRLGLSEGQAAALMSVLSACSMVGRLGFGCLGDRACLPPLAIYGLALVAGGALVAGSLSAGGFPALVAFMGPACCLMGGAASLTTLITVHLDGTHRLFQVFARQSIFQGVGALIGTPAAGALYDITGGYSATFAFVSSSLAASGLMALLVHWTANKRTRRRSGGVGGGERERRSE